MFDFFFYGTLVDADVRRLVLGRAIPDSTVTPALLPGHARHPVVGQPYPGTVASEGSTVDGVVLGGLDVRDAARLSNFEGDDYLATLCPIVLAADGSPATAWVYIATGRVSLAPGPWSVEAWREDHKAAFIKVGRGWIRDRGDAALARHEAFWRARLATGGG